MIVFFGPAGAGKSVQGQMLAVRHGWQWLSTGQMFRSSKDPEVHRILATGDLMSDEQTYSVVEEALEGVKDAKHLIIDGFPRTRAQANWITEQEDTIGRSVKMAIVLEVPESEIIKRLSTRGRKEDTPDIIRKRMNIYRKEMYPILSYFADNGIQIIHIDGTGTVGQVHDRIQAEIEACEAIS